MGGQRPIAVKPIYVSIILAYVGVAIPAPYFNGEVSATANEEIFWCRCRHRCRRMSAVIAIIGAAAAAAGV